MYSWIVTSTHLFGNAPPPPRILKHHTLRFRSQQGAYYRLRSSITACAPSHPQAKVVFPNRFDKSRKVEILPLEVVQRIAAGEVIAGYDSVVQELVENSIDADAKVIKVDIDLSTRSITVQDDGEGISLEQGLADIAKCNATSKLRTLSELKQGVRTLGFRGQGLWAIAMTAARLEICSRTSDSLCGMCVTFTSNGDNGDQREGRSAPVAMAKGTTAKVTGLPWSTEPIEARKVMKRCKYWLLRVALCYPNVKFHLTRNGRTSWKTVGNGGRELDARIRLLAYELKLHPSDFRTASRSIPQLCEMSVVVGTPSVVHSSSKSWMMTAINGRCVGIRSIRQAMVDEVDVKKGRYPVVFVNIVTDAGLVNWNVLPMKTKIRFNSVAAEEKLVAAVPSLLRDALQGTLMAEMGEPEVEDTASFLVDKGLRGGMRGVISLLSGKQPPPGISDTSTDTESENEGNGSPVPMLQARVVAQLLNTYILIEHKGGIMLIEQHVADERVLYEGLLQSWKNNRLVALEEPLRLPENMRTEWIFTLATLGLISSDDPDEINNGMYEIIAIPEVLQGLPKSNLISLLLQACREGSTIEEASASVACRMAVKNGTALNMREMEGIVRKLVRCNNAFTCPHGRPIFMELQTKELARLFGRSWIPERVNNDDTRHTVFKRQGLLAE